MSEQISEYIPTPPNRLKLGDVVWFSNSRNKVVCAINYTTGCVIFNDDIEFAEYNEHYAYAEETGNNYNRRAYLLTAFVWCGNRWELKAYSEWKDWHKEQGWDDVRWRQK